MSVISIIHSLYVTLSISISGEKIQASRTIISMCDRMCRIYTALSVYGDELGTTSIVSSVRRVVIYSVVLD